MALQANTIFHTDSLFLLERLGSGFASLVYLDPPWYPSDATVKQNDGFGQHLEMLSKVVQQAHRVLTDDGTVFFHSDIRLSSTFRLILDQIFKPLNFVAEYILPNRTRFYIGNSLSGHSTILRYSKTQNFVSNRIYRALSRSEFQSKYPYEDEHGYYMLVDITNPSSIASRQFEWKGFRPYANRSWKHSVSELSELDRDNRLHYPASGGMPRLKMYAEDDTGIEIATIWDDIHAIAPSSKERLNYSGQQPITLLERIVKIGSNVGDVILDPFCGTGTTLVAAQTNDRKWIGADLSNEAIEISIKRLTEDLGLTQNVDFFVGSQEELNTLSITSNGYTKVLTSVDEVNPTLRVVAMVAQGEGEAVEFKSTACWNEYSRTKDQSLVENIIETVAGFMNSSKGGILLIGVRDNGEIIGLTNDYLVADKKKKNRDGYELFLRNSINKNLGTDITRFYNIAFHTIEGKDVCQVTVSSTTRAVYYKDELYVRNGNQTSKLNAREAIEYHRIRWQ